MLQTGFGWEIEKWEVSVDYWLIKTGEEDEPGINGAIKDRTANNTTVNTIGVQSVDKTLDRIKEAGGRVLMDKTAIPGFEYHAYCEDRERNVFGIMEEDLEAKL